MDTINKHEKIDQKGLLLIDRFLVDNLKIHEKLNNCITQLTLIHNTFKTLRDEEFFTFDTKHNIIEKISCKTPITQHIQDLFNQLVFLLSSSDEKKEDVDFFTIMTIHEKVDLILQCLKDHPTSQIKILESKELTKQFNQLHGQAFNIPFDTKPFSVLQDYFPKIKHPYFKEFFNLNIFKYNQEKIKIHKEKSEKEVKRLEFITENIKYSKTTETLSSLCKHHNHILEDIFSWDSIFFMSIEAKNFLYSSPLEVGSAGFDICLKAIMDFSEKLNFLLRSYILTPKKPEKRLKAATLCLQMLGKLIKKEDLHGAFTLYSALNAPEISRLHELFETPNNQKKLNRYSSLFSSRKNFKVYRDFLLSCKSPIPIFLIFIKDNTIGNENKGGKDDEINLYKWKFYYAQYKLIQNLQNQHKKDFMTVEMCSNLYKTLFDLDTDTLKKTLFERSYEIRPFTKKPETIDVNNDQKN